MSVNIVGWFFVLVLFSPYSNAQLLNFTKVVKDNGTAVVNISGTRKIADTRTTLDNYQIPEAIQPQIKDLLKRFLQGQEQRRFEPRDSKSLGSGFIISADGYILTNHHVVQNAHEIVVKLKDRRQLIAKLIGSDKSSDIALLKVDAKNLPILKIGSSKNLKVGEWVLAIGSPFGFEQSVTSGIVSAKGRSLPGGNYIPFIQTDVAINPGNSGGPLFNLKGEVVGVNSQIYSRSGVYMGLSFAIPMEIVMNVIEQIKAKGFVTRGWLGVQIQDITRELAESFDMDKPYGALVAQIIPDSPAEKSELQIGDIIIEFAGQIIDTSAELPPIVGLTVAGSTEKIKIIRDGNKKTIKVKIGLLPDEMLQASTDTKSKAQFNRLNLVVTDLSDKQRKNLELAKQGVYVQSISPGVAFNAGIKAGDIILRIQNNIILNVFDFNKTIKELPVGRAIAVLIQRQGNPIFLALKIDK